MRIFHEAMHKLQGSYITKHYGELQHTYIYCSHYIIWKNLMHLISPLERNRGTTQSNVV